jgi:predicted phosphodiesterase
MGRIFVHGDIHRKYIELIKQINLELPKNLNKDDYIIILGDFGMIWNGNKEENIALDKLNNIAPTVLFIDGNHENFERLYNYPIENWHGGKIHRIKSSIIHLMRGQVFNINNKNIFTFGGAQSYDRDYRIEGISKWKQEIPSEEEFNIGKENLKKYNFNVDYILSHTCPECIVPQLLSDVCSSIEDYDKTCSYLDEYSSICNFTRWYLGHWHIYGDYEYKNKQYTCLYNEFEELK